MTAIKSTARTGSDAKLVTGTEGTDTYVAKWNTDGDLVDGFEMLDEDDMASDAADKLASQQSIKAFTDTFAIEFIIDGSGASASDKYMSYCGALFNPAPTGNRGYIIG